MENPYIHSLVDISTDLIEALQESGKDGDIAVAFVDSYEDVFDLRKISYDPKNKCIVVQVGYSGTDLGNFSQEITKVNNGEPL